MANQIQNSQATNNPLFDKMCERFQFQHVAVAEIMLKKAERIHIQKNRISGPKVEKKAWKFTLTPSLVRHASICCSILLIVSVLMLCAIFGTSANSEFSKATGVFANTPNAIASAVDDGQDNVTVYTKDGAEITVITASAKEQTTIGADQIQK